MRRVAILCLLLALISGCTTYEGAAYIKKDLASLACSSNTVQNTIDIKTAKADCIKDVVDEEFFKRGASIVVVDSIRDVDRWRYSSCMADKGFSCTWGPENR